MMFLLLALALTPALQAAAPPPADPHWPAPVMDTVPPALPALRPGAVLILAKTNGYRDDAQVRAAVPAIERVARARHRDVFATENAAVMNPADLARFRVIILSSISGDVFSPDQRTALKNWIEGGGGIVLLHGAGGDPKYDWPWYRDVLLGAQFIGHTGHPNQFPSATITVTAPNHPAMAGLPKRWTRNEEWYAFDRVPTGQRTRILATLDESTYAPVAAQRMGLHPLIWTRCIGRGRAFYSALGHRAETYAEPLHLKLIGNAIRWAAAKRC